MRHTERASAQLDRSVALITDEQVVELALDDLADLLVEPESTPFGVRRSPPRSGLDDLVSTLAAVKRLPDSVTVRVVLPHGHDGEPPVAQAQSALRSRAADLADESWREAMAIRGMGRHQLPLG